MTFTHLLLDEPDLEFGDGGKHPDSRMGLVRYGPLQPVVGDRISSGSSAQRKLLKDSSGGWRG